MTTSSPDSVGVQHTLPPLISNEALSRLLFSIIPAEQLREVFTKNPYAECELSDEFLGFLQPYYALAHLIPPHWTIVDLGAAHSAQAWIYYFTGHQYLSCDSWPDMVPFHTPTSRHFAMTAGEFLTRHGHELNLKETFAICSYCPMWGEGTTEHIRRFFPNLFVYYPHGGPSPSLSRLTRSLSHTRREPT